MPARLKASPAVVVMHDQSEDGCGCGSYAVGIVISGAAILQHRTCLSTEASSVLPRVKIASQREISFWNSGHCERVVVAITRRWREQRMRISQFTAYSLLFTVLCGGSIINLSSIVGSHPVAGALLYASTKGAIETLTKGLALELAPRKIRVNAIAPGHTETQGNVAAGTFEGGAGAVLAEKQCTCGPPRRVVHCVQANLVPDALGRSLMLQERNLQLTGNHLTCKFCRGVSARRAPEICSLGDRTSVIISKAKPCLYGIVVVLLGLSPVARAQSSNDVLAPALVFPAGGAQRLPDAPSAALPDRQQESAQEKSFVPFAPRSQDLPEWKALSPAQKFDLFVQNSYSSSTLAVTAASAQKVYVGHWFAERPRALGQRYAAAYADAQSSAFIENFLVPALMRQDPRYFRSSSGTIRGRLGYAMSRVFITRTDRGSNAFNTSGIAGAFLSSAVRNAYHPYYNRSLDGTVGRALSRLGSRVGMNVVREFWPDLRRKSKGKLAAAMAAYEP